MTPERAESPEVTDPGGIARNPSRERIGRWVANEEPVKSHPVYRSMIVTLAGIGATVGIVALSGYWPGCAAVAPAAFLGLATMTTGTNTRGVLEHLVKRRPVSSEVR